MSKSYHYIVVPDTITQEELEQHLDRIDGVRIYRREVSLKNELLASISQTLAELSDDSPSLQEEREQTPIQSRKHDFSYER